MTDILARAVKLKPKALRHFKIDPVFKDKQAKAAGRLKSEPSIKSLKLRKKILSGDSNLNWW